MEENQNTNKKNNTNIAESTHNKYTTAYIDILNL